MLTAIVGAAITSALGAAILVPRPRAIVFIHEHNLLRPIQSGVDESLLYPSFVFRLLTLPTVDQQPTPRQALLNAWQKQWNQGVPAEARPLRERIVYADGGVYDVELLELRKRLFEELETTLDSLARDVDLLSRTISTTLGGSD